MIDIHYNGKSNCTANATINALLSCVINLGKYRIASLKQNKKDIQHVLLIVDHVLITHHLSYDNVTTLYV